MGFGKGRALVALLVSFLLPAAALAADDDAAAAEADVGQAAPAAPARKPTRPTAPGKQGAKPAGAKKTTAQAAAGQKGAKGTASSRSAKPAAAAKQGKPAAAQAAVKVTAPKLSAAEILERHLAARGGAKAWGGVQAMSWAGKIELGYADSVARSEGYVRAAMAPKGKAPQRPPASTEARKQVLAPFALELKRPEKSRMELQFAGKTAVQVFDGKSGWLLRPYLGRDAWEPFSAEQLKAEQGQWELGGPLVEAAAKGTHLEVVGVEAVDGRAAYKLAVAQPGGEARHVWVDAKTFLDVKVEGTPRKLDGKLHAVWVTQRDFRPVQGLMVPRQTETAVEGYPDTHKMTIERVAVNPRLDDTRFVKPKA